MLSQHVDEVLLERVDRFLLREELVLVVAFGFLQQFYLQSYLHEFLRTVFQLVDFHLKLFVLLF